MTTRYCIIDCFVDEPACFGVPPFVSPYPRYVFGALVDAGVGPENIDYLTIEELRVSGFAVAGEYRWCFVIGGAVVPGKYLGSRIGTLAEITRIAAENRRHRFAVGGPISLVMPPGIGNAVTVRHDIEAFAFSAAAGDPIDSRRSPIDVARWSRAGAEVVARHPDHPHIICEIETYRGCPRTGHCSFCSEGASGVTEFRETDEILAEIEELQRCGVTRFRLGRQADILQYGTRFAEWRGGFPRPEPSALAALFGPLREKRDSGGISVLNIDNANPGTIDNFPEESAEILAVIAGSITPGDTLAMGIESFDDRVAGLNGLKVAGGRVLPVVRMINEIGGGRTGGIPVLLPGINLLHGLSGETPETFETNYRRLMEIRDAGLLVRRINIRQVQPIPGTPLFRNKPVISKKTELRFRYYRDRIREDIEGVMLGKIFPPGTVLKGCRILETRGGYSYGKQISSYSITAKFPVELPRGVFRDALVTGHRERSLAAIPLPVSLNALPQKALEQIPGIGKKRAAALVIRRPFKALAEAADLLESVEPGIRVLLEP